MLYHLTARCILPKSEGGLEVEVMFIDTDYHFDMLRLVTILEHRLSQSSEEVITHCLGRLFLVHCSSSTQLLLTLYSLETVFCGHPSLCLLVLDSLSAFYWIDRANGGESVSAQESTLKKCSHFLEKVVRGEVHLPEVSMGILPPRSRSDAKYATEASDVTVPRKVLTSVHGGITTKRVDT